MKTRTTVESIISKFREFNLRISPSFMLLSNNEIINEKNLSKYFYVHNFKTNLPKRIKKEDLESEIYLDYKDLLRNFQQLQDQLYFRPYITLNFTNFDELLDQDCLEYYKKSDLPELNCVFKTNLDKFMSLRFGMYVFYEDYDNRFKNSDELNKILSDIVNDYKPIIQYYRKFIKYGAIDKVFENEDGLLIYDYYPSKFEAIIIFNIDNPEKILINKLLLDCKYI